jgi:hypothetical protein
MCVVQNASIMSASAMSGPMLQREAVGHYYLDAWLSSDAYIQALMCCRWLADGYQAPCLHAFTLSSSHSKMVVMHVCRMPLPCMDGFRSRLRHDQYHDSEEWP